MDKIFKCPRCRKSVRYDEKNPNRPFCSAVCKDEDIIAWAEGTYRVPGPPAEESGGGADEAAPPPDHEDD